MVLKSFSLEHRLFTKSQSRNHLSFYSESTLKQIGQTEIFCVHSKLVKNANSFRVLPIIDYHGNYTGIQMFESSHNRNPIVLNILDSEDNRNNLLKYKTDLVSFGHQRYYDIRASYKAKLKTYCQVFSVQMDPKVIDKKGFDFAEQQKIL